MAEIAYRAPTLSGQASAVSVTTGETDMLVVSDSKYMSLSQLALYFDLDLSAGTITSVFFRLYYSLDNASSTTWYQVPLINSANGELTDFGLLIDSNSRSYATGKYRAVFDIKMSSCMQFKVTAQGAGSGTATLNTISAVVRDN